MLKHIDIQNPPISDERRLANEAFDRELSELIKSGHERRWVAYLGDKRLEIADDRDALLRKYEREYRQGDLLLARIEEQAPFEAMGFC
jgi:hypothetical protein